ncbi:addiction module antidote protein (plasmid) [Serratia ureilytica]|uniref:addiction module antidote protein n=1 Tax=Serratia ureilytica TaxID=300181 RepID=UPI003722C738
MKKFNNIKEIAEYLNSVISVSLADEGAFLIALGEVATATGIDRLSKEVGMTNEEIDNVLSGKLDPPFVDILKIVKALGLKLHFTGA